MTDRDFGASGTLIECAGCAARGSAHCGDCLVTFLAGRDADDAVVFDAAEERALRLLRAKGLLGEVVERRPAVAG